MGFSLYGFGFRGLGPGQTGIGATVGAPHYPSSHVHSFLKLSTKPENSTPPDPKRLDPNRRGSSFTPPRAFSQATGPIAQERILPALSRFPTERPWHTLQGLGSKVYRFMVDSSGLHQGLRFVVEGSGLCKVQGPGFGALCVASVAL